MFNILQYVNKLGTLNASKKKIVNFLLLSV